jgi:hypothetical protein
MNTAAIKGHMDVIASDGQKIGQVDHMEGSDKIKLARHDAPDGKHHLIPLNWGQQDRPACPPQQGSEGRARAMERGGLTRTNA